MGNGFPKRSVVHRGCTLALIVNAIATVEASFFAVFHQWHDDTFLYDGVDGNHAAIAFEGESLLGTVFDHDSDRSPFRREGAYDLGRLFRGLPATHKRMLDKCLDCQRAEHEGRVVPLVTAAFWDEGESLAAAEPWQAVWDNGASVLHPLFREDLEEALAEWGGGYGLPEAQVNLARSLFERKTADPGAVVALSRDEVQLLRGYAGSGESFEAGRQAFAAIGVQVPAWDE